MKDKVAAALTGVIAAIGALTALYLVRVHVSVRSGATSAGFCNMGETLNCDAAALSDYADIFGIPIAVLGMSGYCAVIVLCAWGILRKQDSRLPLGVGGILQTYFTFASVYSVFLAAVSVAVLPAICPACLGLYAVNAAGLLTTSLWVRRQPLATIAAQISTLGTALVQPTSLAFVGVVVAVGAAGTGYTRAALQDRTESPIASPEPSPADPKLLYAAHAPAQGPADAALRLVVYSDFQCPYCARFAQTLAFARETFGSRLRIEFRHFPLAMHSYAPIAAATGVCAHRQGRFWEFHDRLFGNAEPLSPVTLAQLVQELGLDAGAITACRGSSEVQSIIEQDHSSGRKLGVNGTPAFFVNGTFYNGALPLDELTRVLERELSRASTVDKDEL